MHQKPYRIFADILRHLVKHGVARHLIFHQGISLAVGLQPRALTKLIHIVNVSHPLSVDDFQQDHTLQFPDLFGIGELRFLRFVKFYRLALELLFQFVLAGLMQAAFRHRLQRYDRQKQRIQFIKIPVLHMIVVADRHIHAVLCDIGNHLVDYIPHALAV